jgi:hypothetical protein
MQVAKYHVVLSDDRVIEAAKRKNSSRTFVPQNVALHIVLPDIVIP